MNKITFIFLLFLFPLFGEMQQVLISKVVDHKALDQTVLGIIDGLKEEGFVDKKNITLKVESAQGQPLLAAQIAAKLAASNPEVVVGVGTLSAQTLKSYVLKGKNSYLIFSSITDPVGANLVSSQDELNPFISGVSNFVDLRPQILLIKEFIPDIKTLGILYNPSELNSVMIVDKLKTLCDELNITLKKQTVSKTADVAIATIKLSKEVEAIFVSNDNTVLSALPVAIKESLKVKVPLFVSDTDAVAMGALAAYGPNQYQIGKETAKIIARALRKEALPPYQLPDKLELFINEETALELNLKRKALP